MSGLSVLHQLYPRPRDDNSLHGPVRRRHIIYIQGLFPQGPAYYYALLKKQQLHHAQLYGLKVQCSDLTQIDPLVCRCTLHTAFNGESVETIYDFLDWQDIIQKAHRRSFFYTLAHAVYTFIGHFIDGTFAALLRLRWKFALAWLMPYLIFALIGGFALITLQGIYELSYSLTPAPLLIASIGIAAIIALYRLGRLYFSASMLRSFNYSYAYGKGRTPEFEKRIAAFGDTVTAICKVSDADEVLIVGHSFGGQLAIRTAAEALYRGAFAGNENGRIKLLTVGDAGMHIALMRGDGGARVRKAIFDMAAQKDLPWVTVYSGKDAMSFNNVDPASALKWFEGKPAHVEDFSWPLMYDARLRNSLNERDYRRLRWRFFHLHGLFIMAARLSSANYDYLRIVCGGAPLALSGQRISAK